MLKFKNHNKYCINVKILKNFFFKLAKNKTAIATLTACQQSSHSGIQPMSYFVNIDNDEPSLNESIIGILKM